VKYIYKDIFTLIGRLQISQETWRPNILVFQYVISDMESKNQDIRTFICQVSQEIVSRMPRNSFIVLNDINHNIRARNYFEVILNCLNDLGLNTEVSKYHFVNYYRYGEQHASNDILIDIPPSFSLKYNPWKFCGSAQMVIHKVN
jgi:lipoate-protein ligase A